MIQSAERKVGEDYYRNIKYIIGTTLVLSNYRIVRLLAIGGGNDPSLDLSIHEREWKRRLEIKTKNINRPYRVLFGIEK